MGKEILIGNKVEFLTEDEIIERFRPLITKQIKKWVNQYEYDDLIQNANIGLINAYRRYDINRKCQFITLAIPTIDREIYKMWRCKKKHIRLKTFSSNITDESLDNPIEFIQKIKDDVDIENQVVDKLIYKQVIDIIENMEFKAKQIIKMTYFNNKTQVEIAAEFGITQASVSRKLKRICKNIKEQLQA